MIFVTSQSTELGVALSTVRHESKKQTKEEPLGLSTGGDMLDLQLSPWELPKRDGQNPKVRATRPGQEPVCPHLPALLHSIVLDGAACVHVSVTTTAAIFEP